MVHTKELLNQWLERIQSFLGIPVKEIGSIGAGKKRIGDRITVAMVQTLYKCVHEVSPFIGHLIVDECHRTSSRTFTEAVTAFDTRYVLGLSATPYRRDRLSKLIHWHLGPQVHSIDQAELTENGAILPFTVKQIQTNFTTNLDASAEYSKMLCELVADPERNRLVSRETARQAKNSSSISLVLSDRRKHCLAIAEALGRDFGIRADLLTGDLSKSARARTIERLNAGKCRALVATSQLVGEGFDLPALGAVLLATPMTFKGRVLQAIGRALRPSPGQDHATVIDFVDHHVGVLKASAKARMRTYREAGAIQ
ncbi:helicase C-terminal domain protein [delta proteobacterium NaphS2]|nr:helicase C-terminal domain protein [delta proteobacterium NaphS2]